MTETGVPKLVNSLLKEDDSKHHLSSIHSNEESNIELKDTEIFDIDEINEEDFDVNSSNTITVIRLAPVIDCGKNTIIEGGDLAVSELKIRNLLKNSPTHVTQKREKEEFQTGNSRLNSDQSHSGPHVISDIQSFTNHKIWQDNEDLGGSNEASNRPNTVLTSSIKFHSAGNNKAANFSINENMPVHINSYKLMKLGKVGGSIKEVNTDKSEIRRKRFRSRGKSSSFSSTETKLKSKDSQEKSSSNLQQLREGLNSYDNNSFQFLMKANNTNITTKNPASNLCNRRSRSTCNDTKENKFQESTENNQPSLDTCVKELGENKETMNTKFSFRGSNLKTAKTKSMKRNPFNSAAYSNKLKSSTRADLNFHNLEVGKSNRADRGSYRILRNGKKVYCEGIKILDVNNCKLSDSHKVAHSIKILHLNFSEFKKSLRNCEKNTNSSLTLKLRSEPDDSQECNSSDSDSLNKRVRSYDNNTLKLSMKSLGADSPASNVCSRELIHNINKEYNKLSGSVNTGAENNLSGPKTCKEELGEHRERINNQFSLKKISSKITKHTSMKRNLTISRLYYKKLKKSKRSDRSSPTIEMEKYYQADNRSYRILRSKHKVDCKGMNMLQESKGSKLSHSDKILSRVKKHQPDHSGIRKTLRSYGKSSDFSSTIREIKLKSDPDDSQGSTGQPKEKFKISGNIGGQFSTNNCSNTTTVKPVVDNLASNLHSRQLICNIRKKHNKLIWNEFQENGTYRILRSRSKVHCKGMNMLQGSKGSKLSHSDKVVSRVKEQQPHHSGIRKSLRSYGRSSDFLSTVREIKLKSDPHDSQSSTSQPKKKLKINGNDSGQFSMNNCSNTTTVKPAVDNQASNLHSRQSIRNIKKKQNKLIWNEFQENGSYRILRSRSKVHCKGMNMLQESKRSKLSHSDKVVSRVKEQQPHQSGIRKSLRSYGRSSDFPSTVREIKLKSDPDDSQSSTGQPKKKLKINGNNSGQFSMNNCSNTTTVKPAVDNLASNLYSRQSKHNIKKKHNKILWNEFHKNGSYRILRSRSKVHCKGMNMLQESKGSKLSHSNKAANRVKEQQPHHSGIRKSLRSYGKGSNFSSKVREIKLKSDPDDSQSSTGQLKKKLKINGNNSGQFSTNNCSNTTTVKPAVDNLASNLHSRQSKHNIKKKHNKLLWNEFHENGSYRILRSRSKVHCKGMNMLQESKGSKLSHSDKAANRVKEQQPHQSGIRKSLRSYGRSSDFPSTVREIKLKSDPDDSQSSTGQPKKKLKINGNNSGQFSTNNCSNTTTVKPAVDNLASNLHSRQSKHNIKKKHNKLLWNEFHKNGSYRILRSRSKVHCKGMNMLQECKGSKLSHSDKAANSVKEQHPHHSGIRKSLRSYGKGSNFSSKVREIKLKSVPDHSQKSSSDSDLLSEKSKIYDSNDSYFSVKSGNLNTTTEILTGDSPASNLCSRLSKNNIGKEHTELSGNEFQGSIESIQQPALEIFNEKLEKHKRTINTKFSLRKKISIVNRQSITQSQPITRAHYSKLKSNLRSKYNVPVQIVRDCNQTGKERTLTSSCKVYSDGINITKNKSNDKLLYLHKAADGVKQQFPDNCKIRESFKNNGKSSNFSSNLTEDKLKSNPDDSQKHTLSDSEKLKKRLSHGMQCKKLKISYENTLVDSPSSDVQSRSRNIRDVSPDSSGMRGKNIDGNEKSSNILPVEIQNELRCNPLDDQQCSFTNSMIFQKHDRPEVSPNLMGEKLKNNHKDDYEALDSPRSSKEEITNDKSIDNCTSCLILNSDTSNETSSINKNNVEDEIIEYDTTSSSFEVNNSECNSEENSSESNTNNQLEYDGVADDQRQACSRSEAQEEDTGTSGSGRLVKLETRSGYVVTLTVDQDRPSQFRNDKARKMWDRAMDVNMARMMAQIDTGQYLSDEVQKQIETQKLARELERDELEKKMRWYQVEASMLDVDVKIKSCLNESTSPHKVDQCLKHLETLYNLNIQPLMLKKFSFVFDTIRALQRYVGSEEGVQLREREKFKKKAERIRSKANDIYKKFKDLYPARENENFSQVFASILEAFQAETQNIDVYSLVEDPQSAEE